MSKLKGRIGKLSALTVLAAAFLFTAMFTTVTSDDTAPEPGLGESTTIYINNIYDLADLANEVNNGDPKVGITYTLNTDLDLSTFGPWTPIGLASANSFGGIFEGNDYTIKGLYINSPKADHVGLFGYVQNGVIRNLTLENVNITGNSLVGAVAGMVNGGNIVNCHATGTVKGHDKAGGVAGELYNCGNNGASNSSFVGKVIGAGTGSAFDNIGGITGYISNSKISQCYAEGSVNGRNSVGGIVGHISSSATPSVVTDCYFIGDVTGNDYVGGIVGDINRSNGGVNNLVTKCYAVGKVTGANSVGGIAGYLYNGKLIDCVALNESVKATGSGAGRVIGTVNPNISIDAVISNNGAFSAMIAGGVPFADGQNTGSGRNGIDMSALEINTDGTLGGRFASPPWYIEDGMLPVFENPDMPEYLIPAELDISMFNTIGDVVYSSSAQTPDVTLSALGTGVTFKIVGYEENIDVGTASVTVEGTGRYSGTVTLYFNITEKPLTNELQPIADVVYNGSAWTPAVVAGLAEGRDYTISYTANINVGTVTVTVVGIGNYKGTLTTTFDIIPKTLSDELQKIDDVEYDTTAWMPAVVFGLMEGRDYTITYTDNINAGTATVTVVGIGNYKGTLTTTFDIIPKTLTDELQPIDDVDYNGSAWAIAVVIGIKEGRDYTISYTDNVNAGTVTVTVVGIDNYKGTLTTTFKIIPKTLSNELTLMPGDYIYNGSAWMPGMVSGLTEGRDYTITYTDNIDAGTATVKIVGKGNYDGELTETFEIKPKTLSNELQPIVGEFVYNGFAWTPAVVLGITENRDYTISYENNIDAGTATVKIVGKGNYTGESTEEFTISPKKLTTDMFESIGGVIYDEGSPLTPDVIANWLLKGIDYEVAYQNNINAGTASVTVTGIGNYDGTVTLYFTISEHELEDVFELVPDDFVYKNSPWTPGVIADGLSEGIDYVIAYQNNINAGTASVIITGIGNHFGEITLYFTISPKTLSNELTLMPGDYIYNGSAWMPGIVNGLAEGLDYTISYTNNINANKNASVKIVGIGNYDGELTETFEIKPKTLSNELTLMPGDYIYNGSAWTPGIVDGLAECLDYTVLYTNNINATVGVKASVTIVGKGNYDGSITMEFEIKPKKLTNELALSGNVFEYNGSAWTPGIVGGLAEGKDYTISYTNNINANKNASVTVVGIGNYFGELTETFEIIPKALPYEIALTPGKYVYNGSAWTPATVVGLLEGTDYTISYTDNINAGEVTVTVEGTGNYEGTRTVKFIIEKKQLTNELLPIADVVYDGSAWTPAVVIGLAEGLDYEISYTANVGIGKVTVTVTVEGTGNYEGTLETTFNIIAKALSNELQKIDNVVYNGSAWTPAVVVGLAEGLDYTISYTENINVGTVTVTVEGIGNYSGKLETTFKILPKMLSDELRLSGNVFEYNGSEWTPGIVDGLAEGRDYTISYTKNVDAGIATVTIFGLGNYEGSMSADFVIIPKKLTDELQPIDGYFVYNGSAWNPVVVPGLAEGKDYIKTYANNVNAGIATVTVVGIGNYEGTLTEKFTISPRPITVTPDFGQSKTCGSKDPVLTYTLYDGFRGMGALSGALSREAGESEGKYLITLGTLGGPNYDVTLVGGVMFEITPCDGSEPPIEPPVEPPTEPPVDPPTEPPAATGSHVASNASFVASCLTVLLLIAGGIHAYRKLRP